MSLQTWQETIVQSSTDGPTLTAGTATITETGLEAIASLGSATAQAGSVAFVSGVQAIASLGNEATSGTATVAETGLEATVSLGDVSAAGESPGGTATVTGLQATTSLGAVTAEGAAQQAPVVILGGWTLERSTPPVSIDATAPVRGVRASVFLGEFVAFGEVHVPATARPTGIGAVAQVGTVFAVGEARALSSGIEARSEHGHARAFGVTNPTDDELFVLLMAA